MTDKTETQQEPNNAALEAWKSKRAFLDLIDIKDALIAMGADSNQDGDKNKWKVHGVGNIILKNGSQTWFDGNAHRGGHGTVSLVRHSLGLLKDTEAMKWLAEQFPDYAKQWHSDMNFETSGEEEVEKESSFTPPERHDDGLSDVKNYLHKKRNLPLSLIEREISSGRLYATRKWDDDNKEWGEAQCVFIGPSSAELRSTAVDGFKGCCTGSDSEKSSYQVMFNAPHKPRVVQAEAAVDALSYHVLNPHDFVVSTNGAGRFPYQYRLTLEAFRNSFETAWAFDADDAGDLATQRLFNALFLRDTLSEKWGVPHEKIDEWLIQKKITSLPIQSPHLIFLHQMDFSQEDQLFEEMELQRKQEVQEGTKRKKMVTTLETTGKKLPPTIEVVVSKSLGVSVDVPKGKLERFILTKNDIEQILKKYQATRMRPQKAKDWNEILVRMGVEKSQEYEQNFRQKKSERETSATLPKISENINGQTVTTDTAKTSEEAETPRSKRGRFQRTSVS